MANYLYRGDLPDRLDLGPVVAIDSETMGLVPARDRLCLVQLSGGDGDAHLVQILPGQERAPNLERLACVHEGGSAVGEDVDLVPAGEVEPRPYGEEVETGLR